MKRIAITGGGTGGHLVIAKALKEAALAEGLELIYFGSTYGQDKQWFEHDKGFKARYFFKTSGVVNQGRIGKVFALIKIAIAFFKARRLLKKHKIEAVISVGGYSAAPASFAALSKRLPLYIHEQNARIGRLNQMLKAKAQGFFSSYTQEPVSYPVREELFSRKRLRDEVKSLIFLGGSQGAKAINALALELAPVLKEKKINIIHQCGKKHLESMKEAYKKLDIEVELFAFSEKIADYLDQADLAIARAGASTVWELTALQLPAIFIPYPYAANDHQASNAQSHVDAGASWMMRETEIDTDEILKIISKGVQSQSEILATLLKPQGAKEIILKVINV